MKMRIRLKAPNGMYLSSHTASEVRPITVDRDSAGETEEFDLFLLDYSLDLSLHDYSRVRTGDRAGLRTIRYVASGVGYQRFRGDRYVMTVDSLDRFTSQLYVNEYRFWSPRRDRFEITRLDSDTGPLVHGSRIALRFVGAERPGWLSLEPGTLQIVEKASPEESETFIVEEIADLKLFWHQGRLDNFSTATLAGERDAISFGYQFVRVQGRVYMNGGPNRKPLYLFWHPTRQDNFVAAGRVDAVGRVGDEKPPTEGERDALAEGYTKVRIEGYVLDKPVYGSIPLRTYFRGSPRNDHFATTSIRGERDAADANYVFIRDEGYILPAYVAVSTPPDLGVPTISHGSGNISTDVDVDDLLSGGDISGVHDEVDVGFSLPRRRRQSNKVALVLSGGSARGCFEVGAVKRLYEEGFEPQIITGVSVGALNAAKLAEGPGSVDELEAIWGELAPPDEGGRGGRAVYLEDYYLKLGVKWFKTLLIDSINDIIGAGLDLDPLLQRLKFLMAHLHAVHSMQPLRELVHRHLDLDAIRASEIELRIGITDLGTGQYFSVTEPFPRTAPAGLPFCGRIDVEPDHRLGETWLSRPIFGADSYAMSIEDAIYASSVQPLWMDPKILNLRDATPTRFQDERIALLLRAGGDPGDSTYLSPAVRRILTLTDAGDREVSGGELSEAFKQFLPGASEFDLEQFATEGFDPVSGDSRFAHRHLYDGGLRDTMAIRTAMRLGARDIIVITGERLQAQNWSFRNPSELETDFLTIPALQYGLGLLGLWFNEAARTDMLLAVAQNEFLGWLYRCFSLLEDDKRQQMVREFNEYWASHGVALLRELGGSSWLGGNRGFHVSPGHGITPAEAAASAYGVPFRDEGCRIRYIAPSEELLDPLKGFDDFTGIREGMEMGYEAARNPIELSFPVPDDLIHD
jgi:predicted acylesterase/phospholipase RssA